MKNKNSFKNIYLMIFFLLLNLINFILSEEKYISLSFYTINKKGDKNDYFKYYYNSYTYSKVEIGSNKQSIEMQIKLDKYFTYFLEDNSLSKDFKFYSKNYSNTFKEVSNVTQFYAEDFYDGSVCQEKIKIETTDINPFEFIYTKSFNDYFNFCPGSIGLAINYKFPVPKKDINFIDQLKSKNIISGYGITIIFDNKNKEQGKFFIGPDIELVKKEYSSLIKTSVKAGSEGYSFNDWGFIFNLNLVGQIYLKSSDTVKLSLDNEFIIGVDDYTDVILTSYFDKLIQEKKCIMEDFPQKEHFHTIKCDKNLDVSNFPEIQFIVKDLNQESFIIEFTYHDLFEKKNDYQYFKIILPIRFLEYTTSYEWVFGRVFFQKYMINLNRDKKIISFYVQPQKTVVENSEIKSKTIIIVLVVIIIILLVLFIFLLKCFYQNVFSKKRRSNVLVDELEYLPQDENK